LSKEFRGFVAVKSVDLKVRRGTIHALIGPNGAGKTTCFNLLTRFLPATSGTIFYKGEDITRTSPGDIARKGLVRSFQISAVFPFLTSLENVRIALQRTRGRSFDFWRSDRVLRQFDERARELLSAVLMVEHNLGIVASLSQRITVLARGEVLAEGDYQTVSKDPAVVAAYLGTEDA
jgi:branched-chain amino acid transport system ATP-binding protein